MNKVENTSWWVVVFNIEAYLKIPIATGTVYVISDKIFQQAIYKNHWLSKLYVILSHVTFPAIILNGFLGGEMKEEITDILTTHSYSILLED